jgi:hypothetical protein
MRFLKLLLAAFIFFMLPIAIHADGYIDVDKKGSVTIVFPEADTEFHFYKVASVNEDGTTVLKKQYWDTNLDLLTPTNWEKDAETLASAIRAHNAKLSVDNGNKLTKINADFSLKTKNGSGTKKNIPVGVYLVVGDAKQVGDIIYYPTPFLLSMPSTGTDAENIQINYDIVIDPVKHTEKAVEEVYYKVVKHWDASPDIEIPDYIDIAILHGDDMVDPEEVDYLEENPVRLDESNNWTYSWGPVELDTEPWSVWEFSSVPGFRTTIESSEGKDGDATEITFTVTNTTYLNPSTTPEETKTPTPTPTDDDDEDRTPTPRYSPSPSPGTNVPPGGPTPPGGKPPGVPNTSDRNNVMWSIIGLCASGMIALVSGIIVLRNSE